MRICYVGKDGGAESTVWGFWLIEIKSLFSVALLCFEDGTRDAYHNHAFHAISWLLRGRLEETVVTETTDSWQRAWRFLTTYTLHPSWRPIRTSRNRMHQVRSVGRSWVLTFRGPWRPQWQEFRPAEQRTVTLTHGRREV